MTKDDERTPREDDIESLLAECFDAIEDTEDAAFVPPEEIREREAPASPPPEAHRNHPAEADIASPPPQPRRAEAAHALYRPTAQDEGGSVLRVHLFTVVTFLLAALGGSGFLWMWFSYESHTVPLSEAVARMDADIESAPQSFAAKAVARAVLHYALSTARISESDPESALAGLTEKLSLTGEDTELAAEFFVQAVEANVSEPADEADDLSPTDPRRD